MRCLVEFAVRTSIPVGYTITLSYVMYNFVCDYIAEKQKYVWWEPTGGSGACAGRERGGGVAAAGRDHSQGQTATIECENLIQVIFIAGVKESIIFPQRRLLGTQLTFFKYEFHSGGISVYLCSSRQLRCSRGSSRLLLFVNVITSVCCYAKTFYFCWNLPGNIREVFVKKQCVHYKCIYRNKSGENAQPPDWHDFEKC